MSSKMKIIKFQPEHLQQIELKENYSQGDCPKTVMNSAFTFMKDDKIIAIIGGFPFVPGVIHFWAFISKHVRSCPLDFHKEVLKMLDWYEVNEKPRRIQFEVRASYVMGARWAEALGFQCEGRMRRWMPDGEDSYLYGRLNKCQP
jgi:hypothetical protein